MIPREELTIPEAAAAMELTVPDVRRLVRQGALRSRQVAGKEVIAASEIRRYWYETAAAESAAAIARMNEEDAHLGREAEERTLNRALRSVPLPFLIRPAGCVVSLAIIAAAAAVSAHRLTNGAAEQASP